MGIYDPFRGTAKGLPPSVPGGVFPRRLARENRGCGGNAPVTVWRAGAHIACLLRENRVRMVMRNRPSERARDTVCQLPSVDFESLYCIIAFFFDLVNTLLRDIPKQFTENYIFFEKQEIFVKKVQENSFFTVDKTANVWYNRRVSELGCRQAVRHGTLTPASVGSNPAIPAMMSV